MNKALKRKVNNISMPVEIHRNDWLMLFCIHLAIFKSAALLQKFVSRSEWHSKRAEINYKYCMALIFGCECWADSTQAAILHLSCLYFLATWELHGEGSTQHSFVFFMPLALLLPCLQHSCGLLSIKYTTEQLCSCCAWEATYPPRRMWRSDP